MKRRERSAPIWLFSFVDLAFLLLIAFTQLVPDPEKTRAEVAELELPRIESVEPSAQAAPGAPRWQLRVLPIPASDDPKVARAPFELIEPGLRSAEPGAADPAGAAPRATAVGAAELASRLDQIRDRAGARPILTPHRDARSEDLLVAVSLLERVWQNDRGVTVEPLPAAISAGPADAVSPSASDREAR